MTKRYSKELKLYLKSIFFLNYKTLLSITFLETLPFELAHLMLHACKKSGWVPAKILREKQMFRVSFISSLRDFTGHLTSRILGAGLTIEIRIYAADACVLAISCAGYARVRLKTL